MKTFLFAFLLGAAATPVLAQSVIADWTFETSIPGSAGPFSPELGAGSAVGFHSAATTYSSPAGNGSAHSFSSTDWLSGDYYQFQVSTTGDSGIRLSWDQTSSGTGPRDFELEYSTNGSVFTDVASYTVLANGTSPNAAWNATTPSSAYSFSDDLSSIAALNNQATVYLRLAAIDSVSASGGAVGTGGTDRVDNVDVIAIPETSLYALVIGLAGFLAVFVRRAGNGGLGTA